MIEAIVTIGFILFLVAMAFAGKWVVAIFAILCGSKSVLHEVGSLCDDEQPRSGAAWYAQLERWRLDDEWRRRGGHDPDDWRRRGEGNMH